MVHSLTLKKGRRQDSPEREEEGIIIKQGKRSSTKKPIPPCPALSYAQQEGLDDVLYSLHQEARGQVLIYVEKMEERHARRWVFPRPSWIS